MLDRPLRARRTEPPASTLERAAPLGSGPAVDQLTPLVVDRTDDVTSLLGAAVMTAASIGPDPRGWHQGRFAGGCTAGFAAAGIVPQNAGSVARVSRET